MVTVKLLWLIIFTIAIRVEYTSTCPAQCLCQINNQISHVTCANQSLKQIPENIPITVTDLDLQGNYLSSLTDVFQNLTQVQTINLSLNEIEAFQSTDFKYNVQLEQLNLAGNQLSSIQEKSFQYIPRLKGINLANNSIKSLNSAIFFGLFNLQDLQLEANQISNVSSDALQFADTLIRLDLSANFIRELPNNVFANLTTLKEINLSNNLLTSFDGQFMFGQNDVLRSLNISHNFIKELSNLTFPNLTTFDLSWNSISSLREDYFENLQNLKSLVLDGIPLDIINITVFQKLKNLKSLSMSYLPNLFYLSKSTFDGLEMLEVLKLSNNPLLSFIHKQLFLPLYSVSIIDLSYNSISSIHNETVFENSHLTNMNIIGNNFTCDCAIEWLISNCQSNQSVLVNSDQINCFSPHSKMEMPITDIHLDDLHCSEVKILNYSSDSAFKLGKPALLKCVASSDPAPEIVWITPRKKILTFHNFHHLAATEYLHPEDQVLLMASSDTDGSYHSEYESKKDRIKILADGSLFIEYFLRSDGGPYKCVARNPQNSTEIVINVTVDYAVLNVVKIWSLIVGFSCAGGFFLLNLTYSLTLAAVRRCVSQRRRERIRHIFENMDQYKTAHLARIKENYNHQVGRIRDQYNYQLGRLREHHQNQVGRMGRMREGASQRVEKMRDNYNIQLGRLKDYSSSQLLQLREKYNSQVDKMKDYGNDKLDKIHEKYKLKQQHVIKLIEMMNLDSCRTVFESECVRTESMILHSDLFPANVPLHSRSGSFSTSDSEYVTASSSESSMYSSKQNITQGGQDAKGEIDSDQSCPINPYLPETEDNYDANLLQLMSANNESLPNEDDPGTSHGRKPSRRRHKHHRKHKNRGETSAETQMLYDYCSDNERNEALDSVDSDMKKCIQNEPKETDANVAEKNLSDTNDTVWHTSNNAMLAEHISGNTNNVGAQSIGPHVNLNQSQSRRSRKKKKLCKTERLNYNHDSPESTNNDDISIDIGDENDEFDTWTVKESVV